MHDSKFEESDKEEEYMLYRMNDPTSGWQGFNVAELHTNHVDSEEYDSDYICNESSEEEDEPLGTRHGRRRVEFNDSADMRDPQFVIGMVFPTCESFKKAIKEYSIVKHRKVWLQKNYKERVRAKCSDGYPWTVFASVEKDGLSFKVKTLNDEHTYGLDFSSKRLSSWWLAKKYLGQWRANPTWSFSGFKQLVLDDLKVDVTK